MVKKIKNKRNNKIKLVALDMDGTLVQYNNSFQSTWRAIADAYGYGDIVEANEKRFYGKKDKDYAWSIEEAALLRGRKVSMTKNHLLPPPYSPGAEDFLINTKGRLIRGIITTGLGLVAYRITTDFNLEFVRCNVLHKNNGKFTGTLDYNVPLWEKDRVLSEVIKEFNINLKEVAYVGDNNNDIPLFKIVGLPVAFNPKTEQTAAAAEGHVIKHFKELEEILF